MYLNNSEALLPPSCYLPPGLLPLFFTRLFRYLARCLIFLASSPPSFHVVIRVPPFLPEELQRIPSTVPSSPHLLMWSPVTMLHILPFKPSPSSSSAMNRKLQIRSFFFLAALSSPSGNEIVQAQLSPPTFVVHTLRFPVISGTKNLEARRLPVYASRRDCQLPFLLRADGRFCSSIPNCSSAGKDLQVANFASLFGKPLYPYAPSDLHTPRKFELAALGSCFAPSFPSPHFCHACVPFIPGARFERAPFHFAFPLMSYS